MRRGSEYEERVCLYLQDKGYSIVARNYHCRGGEIDIVARQGGELVFVEVKGGKDTSLGHPAERFNPRKLDRIITCAFRFMEEMGLEEPFRVDLVVVLEDRIEHYENVGYEF